MNRTGTSIRASWMARTALGAALALGTVMGATALPVPAQAAEKAPKLQLSKGFLAAAQPAQAAVNAAVDEASIAAAKTAVDGAFAAAENDDDRFMAGSLAVSLGGKAKDPVLQRKGVKAMLASGKVAPETLPQIQLAAGQLAYQAKDYPDAIANLEPLAQSGKADGTAMVVLAESYIATNQVDKGLGIFDSAIKQGRASGQLAPDSWYRRAIASAFSAKNISKAADFGAMLIADYPDPKNVGVAVTVVRELGNYGSQETLDLMRLMGRTNSYNEQRDYVEYIQAADPRRLPGEVLDVINAGTTAGKLSGSDTFVADAKTQASGRLSADKASLSGYEADARKSSATEATVSGAADALLSYKNAAAAEELYKTALTKSGVDANRTQTRLGIAQVDQGKYADAQATFAKVTGPRQPIAKLWSAYALSKTKPATAAAPAPAQ